MNDPPTSWLDKECFTYPGWEKDYKLAQEASSNHSTRSAQFRNAVHRLNEKQRVLEEGDRSHPRLVALDQLAAQLTYPGWQDDVANAEKAHFDNYYDETNTVYFQSKLEGLQHRQQFFFGYNTPTTSSTTTNKSPAEITAMLGACVICGERPKSHLFDPCGHLCACQSCADQVMRQDAAACPICRVPSHKVMRVFFT